MRVKDLLCDFRRRSAAKNNPVDAATFEFVEFKGYIHWFRGHIIENKLPDESMARVEGLLVLGDSRLLFSGTAQSTVVSASGCCRGAGRSLVDDTARRAVQRTY